MKSKFHLHEAVIADRDVPEQHFTGAPGLGKPAVVDGKVLILQGTRGAIVDIQEDAGDVGVEFFDEDGQTIEVAFVPESFVRRATSTEASYGSQRRAG